MSRATVYEYDLGDRKKVKIRAYAEGVLTDADSITTFQKTPDGQIQEFTPTRVSTGTYELLVTFDQSGEWAWRTVTSGNLVAADVIKVRVRMPGF